MYEIVRKFNAGIPPETALHTSTHLPHTKPAHKSSFFLFLYRVYFRTISHATVVSYQKFPLAQTVIDTHAHAIAGKLQIKT